MNVDREKHRCRTLSRRNEIVVVGHEGGVTTEVDLPVVAVDEHDSWPILAGFGIAHRSVRDEDHDVARVHEMSCCAVDPDDTRAAVTGDRVSLEPGTVGDVDD